MVLFTLVDLQLQRLSVHAGLQNSENLSLWKVL